MKKTIIFAVITLFTLSNANAQFKKFNDVTKLKKETQMSGYAKYAPNCNTETKSFSCCTYCK